MKTYQQLFAELKRRKVFKVAGVYGVVAFALIQVADPLVTALNLPTEFLTYIVVLLLLGFPVAIVLAWAFEVTPDGMQKTGEAAPGEIEAIVSLPASKRWPAGLMALAGVGALIAGAWWVGRQTAPESATDSAGDARLAITSLADDTRPSIAVLPFADMSPDGDQEYFSDGMTEEILNVLAKLPDLRVTARTSAFAFKGLNLDLRAVGDSLGVRYIVEGSVRKDLNQLRITAQLIDAADGSHLWSDSYNRTLENVFQIQVDIAEAIAQELRVPLGIDDPSDLVTPTADLEAYDLYLAGRARIRERGDSLSQAIRLFEGALERDSTWAPAWAGLAEASELISWYTNAWGIGPVPYEEIAEGFAAWQSKAETAANRAFELDPDIASAHVAMGSVHRNRKEWELGEAAYLRALSLDPDNGEAHHQYADLLGQMGRLAEALALSERGLDLDRLPVRLMNYSTLLAADDRLDLAIGAAREGILLDPDKLVWGLRRRLLEYQVLTGQFDSMFVYGSGMRTREPTEEEKSAAIEALHSGDLAMFPRVFLEERDWTSFWMVFGQPDSAAVDLQSKVAVRPRMSPTWIWQSVYDPIREHPVYLETMRALNLEGVTAQRTPR